MWASSPATACPTRWRAGFHVTKSEHVDAPVIDELPLALECKLVSYDEETRLLTGEIVNVSVDERALDENGKLAVETESAASRRKYGTRRFFAVSVRISTLFVQNRRISVKISLNRKKIRKPLQIKGNPCAAMGCGLRGTVRDCSELSISRTQ